MKFGKLNPTLFDKLTLGDQVTSLLDAGRTEMQDVNAGLRRAAPASLERYSEAALRASVRREVSWLLNTVQMEASVDLSATPQVKTSVLNFGCPDLTGQVMDQASIDARARDIRDAIQTFEPRLNPKSLQVSTRSGSLQAYSVAYAIRGDITAAVQALPVEYVADIDVGSGQAVVRD